MERWNFRIHLAKQRSQHSPKTFAAKVFTISGIGDHPPFATLYPEHQKQSDVSGPAKQRT
jgi:hypothetical protein